MKSDKFKQKINTFSVILRSQNIHLTEIKNKFDKYSEKFLTLLDNILFNELKHYMLTALPKVSQNRIHNICLKRHKEILNNLNIADDDSCLSGLEDEIMISCQKGPTNDIENVIKKTRPIQKELAINIKQDEKKASEEIKSDNNYDTINNFKNFIEKSQNDEMYKPLINLYKESNKNMEIDYEIKQANINPVEDPSSNYNSYRRKFVPPINKTKDRLKDTVPFLKLFNPKFLKKENIDKKILRRFRNYVKTIFKTDMSSLFYYDHEFWKNFSNMNLLPPMKYIDRDIEVEFKSFNIKYMIWLFSKNGTVELYKTFTHLHSEELLNSFVEAYDLYNNTEEVGIIDQLREYIISIPEIYSSKYKHHLETISMCNFSVTTKLQSEDVLDNYLGDFNYNSQTFKLNEFDTIRYPRCGNKFVDDCYESMLSFDMNVSMDSIQSAE